MYYRIKTFLYTNWEEIDGFSKSGHIFYIKGIEVSNLKQTELASLMCAGSQHISVCMFSLALLLATSLVLTLVHL